MTRADLLATLKPQGRLLVTPEEHARLAKWRKAAELAHDTGKMANTLAKALAQRYADRWRFVDFRGKKGRESAGIVDILAIRKCGKPTTIPTLKRLDLFDIKLIQVKGGSAPLPTSEELARLRTVQHYYHAEQVVLFQWIKGVGQCPASC